MGVKYVNGKAVYTIDKGTDLNHEAKINNSKIQNSEKRTKALTKEYKKTSQKALKTAKKQNKKKKKKEQKAETEAKRAQAAYKAIVNKSGITGGYAQRAANYRKENPVTKQKKKTSAKKDTSKNLTSNEALLLQNLSRTGSKNVVKQGVKNAEKTLRTSKAKTDDYKNLSKKTEKKTSKPSKQLSSNESLLVQNLTRTGTPNVVNKGLKGAEKSLRTSKAKTDEYKDLNKKVAKQDEKFLNSSPFAYGFMSGTSPIPLKETLELQTGRKIDTSKAEKSVGYKAGYMTGLAAEYATTGGVARDAVQQSIKTALKQAGKKAGKEAVKDVAKDASKQIAKNSTKLTEIGKRVLPGMAADTITGVPTNALEAGKEASKAPKGEKGKEFAKSLAVNTAFDVGMGAAGEGVSALVKSIKTKTAEKAAAKAAEAAKKKVKAPRVQPLQERLAAIREARKEVPQAPAGASSIVKKAEQRKVQQVAAAKSGNIDRAWDEINEAKAYIDSAKAEYNRLREERINSLEDYIKNYEKKGSKRDYVPANNEYGQEHYIPQNYSLNDKWYSDYYKANGKAPAKKDARAIAEKLVDEGAVYKDSEFFDADLSNLKQTIDSEETIYRSLAHSNDLSDSQLAELAERFTDKELGKRVIDRSALEKDLGADINRVKDTTEENIKEYGQFVKDGKRTNVPQATAYGDTTQGAVNIRNSKEFEEAKDAIDKGINEGSFAKHTETQKTALSRADETIANDGLDVAAGKVAGYIESTAKVKKEVSQDQIMLGYKVAQKYLDEGNIEKAVDVLSDTAMLESEAGRALQAARIFSSLTPAGKVKSVTKVADKLSKEKNVDITLNKELLEKLSKATDADEAARIQNDIAVDMWNQVPPTIMDKINAWRYTSMLSSPKTHIRNMLGNAMFVPFRIISNGLQVGMEKAFVKEANRTRAILNPATDKNLIKMGAEDYKKVEFTLRNNTKYIDTRRPQDARVYKLKPLEGARKFVSWSLDAEDGLFMKYHYSRAYARYLKAQKIKGKVPAEVAEKARAFASQEALEGTYRDANAISDFLNNIRQAGSSSDNKGIAALSKMMLDTTVPFTKTPANILKQGTRYSPLGLAKGLVDAGFYGAKKSIRSPEQLSKVIKEISEGLTGTGATALGMYLAYEGLINTSIDTQSKKGQYDKMLGEQEYSVNVGDYTFTVDWAIPVSIPLFLGAELGNWTQSEGLSFVDSLAAFGKIAEPLLNLSMLSGIENTFNTAFAQGSAGLTIIKNSVQGYISQFFPSLLAQIAKTTTETRKSTKATNESTSERQIKRFLNQLTNKVPIANENLADYVDLWGGKETKYSNSDYFTALLQNVFSPGTLKKRETTHVDDKLLELYERLGDSEAANKIIPQNDPGEYGFDFGGKHYQMTEKDLEKYKVTRGKQSYDEVSKLMSKKKYRNMSDDERVKEIAKVYEEAGTYAKEEFLKSKGVSETDIEFAKLSDESKAKFNNMPSSVTKEAYVSVMSSKAKKEANTDKKGTTPSQAEAKAYLDKFSYSREVKAELWQAYNAGWAARNNPYR